MDVAAASCDAAAQFLVVGVAQFFEDVAQRGAAVAFFAGVVLDDRFFVRDVFGAYGEAEGFVFAIDVDDFGFDFVANGQQFGQVFNALNRRFGGFEDAVDVVAQLDDSLTLIYFTHDTLDDAATAVSGGEGGKGILAELFDAQ